MGIPMAFSQDHSCPWWKQCPWTLGLASLALLLNLGLFRSESAVLTSWLGWLQFDRQSILAGQVWRLVTGNLVHWSAEHFLLDIGAFLVVGVLYERLLNRSYPWILLMAALAVGCGVLLFRPDMQTYRGLSGVDSGQFAAALGIEALLATRDRRRWIWVAPAAALFLAKIVYESTTGVLFFGTESLGDLGQPIPLAHLAGTAAAGAWFFRSLLQNRRAERRRGEARFAPRTPQNEPVPGRPATLLWPSNGRERVLRGVVYRRLVLILRGSPCDRLGRLRRAATLE